MYITQEITYTDSADFFTKLKTSIAAAGWVQVDTTSELQVVFRTYGELGTHVPIYLEIYRTSTTSFTHYFRYWQHWDEVNHVGVCEPATNTRSFSPLANFTYRFYGSKDTLAIHPLNTTYDSGFHIYLLSDPTQIKRVVQGTLTAGTDVVITLDSVDGIGTGHYNVYGILGEGQEHVEVISVDKDALTVTVASLAENYIGSQGNILFGIAINPMSLFAYRSFTDVWHLTKPSGLTQENITSGCSFEGFFTISVLNNIATGENNYYTLVPSYLKTNYRMVGFIEPNTGNCMYCGNAPGMVVNDIFIIPGVALPIEYSTITSSAGLVITDSTKNWTIDEHVGRMIVMTNGANEDYSRYIESNTATTLTIRSAFINTLGTDTYTLADEVWRRVSGYKVMREVS